MSTATDAKEQIRVLPKIENKTFFTSDDSEIDSRAFPIHSVSTT